MLYLLKVDLLNARSRIESIGGMLSVMAMRLFRFQGCNVFPFAVADVNESLFFIHVIKHAIQRLPAVLSCLATRRFARFMQRTNIDRVIKSDLLL